VSTNFLGVSGELSRGGAPTQRPDLPLPQVFVAPLRRRGRKCFYLANPVILSKT